LASSARSIAFIVDPFEGFRVGMSIVVCEFASAIGTGFFAIGRGFSSTGRFRAGGVLGDW
jgi:hypothetical protein